VANKAPIALKTNVAEAQGVASKPVLPNHAPERSPRDRARPPGNSEAPIPPLGNTYFGGITGAAAPDGKPDAAASDA